ncbi:hypothetical protein VF14_29485 [Nostoc linckia z18]|jgi:pimeloyl-ACP methyl ester carboxylesterase|uniref:DUF726 domain-containing protein n=2 Tax=Nostoc linckia TaxID=92942 RepID=A0A9Q5ZFL0_NOSLI|nr:DUF726 domain-containing protein [Nostoc linckia]PHK38493.1 hypothetical protein VF12_17920 [Nostoc linckia z15]PHK47691.1 hypothetical protein VF13_04470 [Nostoc linckia z16]PHJ59967.1 hypothetical protein VF02_23690 [Nostoc linckia z1]PHJ67143.1 hypothetical protein VF05_18055 [Nostoc linckia z3]PHJ69873.1 hypothetical protein VF03_23065 [Nostoc linckia z2]
MECPELRLISSPPGSFKALVFIDGYLSEDKVRDNTLLLALNYAGWQHSIYQLYWDASNKLSCTSQLVILNWHKCKSRAACVGKDYLPSLIKSQIPEENISLVAHSLGARVAYYCMDNWSVKGHSLENIILLGGAVRRDSSKNWGYVASKIKGSLINVYNDDDFILKTAFKLAELGNNPCGRKPIKEYHSRIINEDATSCVGKTHSLTKYINYLPNLVNKGLWQI